MTKWLSILDNNDEWARSLLSSDISYVLMVYDLLQQTLDPCSFILDEIESIDNLENVADSIITQTVAIYYS